MRGRVTVQLFRLDSDGLHDPNLYSWTSADYSYSTNQVMGAFTFWVNEATNRNIPLSFRVNICDPVSRYTRSYAPSTTHYEPITHGWSDDYLWVNDALYWKNYAATTVTPENVYQRNEDFNRAQKTDPVYGPFDGSFSVYVVYNPPPAPSTFADGYRAYAMVDGPFVMLMWNSAGWQPQNLGRVLTHETGHIFWACDEYYDAPSATGCTGCGPCWGNAGPRPWAVNANCGNVNAVSCDSPTTDCIMKSNNYVLCPRTPAQIGW